ncbi:serine carboxypeptidase [Coprinopsis sp. MPI-PUGE-AT-0042]|nr:serine carboxypeptidase [Coprinopsis sp. MPI-PUGE-AT-0042]
MWPCILALLLQWFALCHLSTVVQAHSASDLGPNTASGLPGNVDATGSFSPLEHLSSVPESQFTVLSHPVFPRHSVRIKKTKFCDDTVGVYTGYIDFGARHLFFTFFESRGEPSKDDVILWIPGGPGCSSSVGILTSLGPCRFSETNHSETVLNPQSWNTRANLLFVDTPIGVGFSYADNGEAVMTTDEAAEDISTFVHIFFEHFSQFQGRKFHISGGSYGGRSVPVFASYIYDHNAELLEKGLNPINLVSAAIGNGFTHFASMYGSFYEMACTPASVPPILGIKTCVRMKQAQLRCSEWLEQACIDSFDALACQAAASFCENELQVPVLASGRNPYDISRECDGKFEQNLCYPEFQHIPKYLDRTDIRALLGVDQSLNTTRYAACSAKVNQDFTLGSLDHLHTSHLHVAALLERGVQVLVFVGKNDFDCNHVGNRKWVMDLDWSKGQGFRDAKTKDWLLPSLGQTARKAGDVRSYGCLTFLTIDGAGHLSPHDKPDELLWMINGWMDGLWS